MKKTVFTLITVLALLLAGCSAPTQAPPVSPCVEVPNLSLTYKDTTITLGAPAQPVLQALGQAKSQTEAASCVFPGMERTYDYGSFYLTTYEAEGEAHICRLWFADDSIATAEGLHIGSTKEEAEGLYCACGDCPVITLVQNESQLTVFLDNDVVTSIQYDLVLGGSCC